MKNRHIYSNSAEESNIDRERESENDSDSDSDSMVTNNLNELTVTMRVTCGNKFSLNKNTLTGCDSERNSDRKGK